MPARTSTKTHKRHRPKSRAKPRKSKPRKRTARKNGRRGKPTRRRRVRGGGPKPTAAGGDSDPRHMSLDERIEYYNNLHKEGQSDVTKNMDYDTKERHYYKIQKKIEADLIREVDQDLAESETYIQDQAMDKRRKTQIEKDIKEKTKNVRKMESDLLDEQESDYNGSRPFMGRLQHELQEKIPELYEEIRDLKDELKALIADSESVNHEYMARMTELRNALGNRWIDGTIAAVNSHRSDKKAAGGDHRKLTDVLVEDYTVPEIIWNQEIFYYHDDGRGDHDHFMTFDGSEFREYPEHRQGTWHGYYEDAKDEEERPMKEAERARAEAEEEATRVRAEAERTRIEAELARVAALPKQKTRLELLRERRKQKMRDEAEKSSTPAPPAAPPAAPQPHPTYMPLIIAQQIVAANNERFIIRSSRSREGQQYLQDTTERIPTIWIGEKTVVPRSDVDNIVTRNNANEVHQYYDTRTYYMINIGNNTKAWIRELPE